MKDYSNIAKYIKNLIAQDRLEEAVQVIKDVCASNVVKYHDSAILLSMEVFGLEEAEINGTVSWEKYRLERRNLANRMLKITNAIERYLREVKGIGPRLWVWWFRYRVKKTTIK